MTAALPRLTAFQVMQLRALLDAGALDSASAKGPFDSSLRLCNPLVFGRLRDAKLVESRTHRPPGGSQRTLYWLTAEGARVARQLPPEQPH